VTVRNEGTQSLATGRTPASPRHIGRCPCLVDEDELVGIEVDLAVEPLLSPFQDVWPFLLGGIRGLFLSVILRRWKKRDNAEMLKMCPSAASDIFNSSNVLSGLDTIRARMRSACASIARERRSPPCGLGVTAPVSRACATQRIALDTPT
jgi:hypothetical protein